MGSFEISRFSADMSVTVIIHCPGTVQWVQLQLVSMSVPRTEDVFAFVLLSLYSDISANEHNSFRNHIR